MEGILSAIASFLWGAPVLILIAAVGIMFAIRTKFFQFRNFGHIMKNTAGQMFKKGVVELPARKEPLPLFRLSHQHSLAV